MCQAASSDDAPQVAPDFNFAAFVSDYLAEEFSSVVKFDVFMWLLAIVWVAFPRGWYAGFAVTAFFVILSVASGAKLHAVAINLALQAPADPAATKNVAQSPPPVHSAGTGHGGRAARPALIPQVRFPSPFPAATPPINRAPHRTSSLPLEL